MDVISANYALVTTSCLTLLITVLIQLYFREKSKYWERRGVTGPRTSVWTIVEGTVTFMRYPLTTLIHRGYKQYGRLYGAYQGTTPLLIVAEPDLLKDILVKDFHNFVDRQPINSGNKYFDGSVFSLKGHNWKRVRTILTPTFTSGKMRKMYKLMDNCVEDVVQFMGQKATLDKEADVKVIVGNYTMDVIARCCFATKMNPHQDPDNKFIKMASGFFKFSLMGVLSLFVLPTRLSRWWGLGFVSRSSSDFFKSVTLHLMRQRKERGIKGDDFLQLMIDVKFEEGMKLEDAENEANDLDNPLSGKSLDFDIKSLKKKSLDEDEVISQSVQFFTVGQGTTAALLVFMFYELALNQDVQEKLYNEIREHLALNADSMSYDLLKNMDYLNAVVNETLRLYPPAVLFDRLAIADYKLGDTGITICGGTAISVPVCAIHRDPEFFPYPEKFTPQRFMPENKDNIRPFMFIPFGAGPRHCIAYRFALLETKLAAAKVLLNFKLTRNGKTDVPINMVTGSGFFEAKRLILGIEKRV